MLVRAPLLKLSLKVADLFAVLRNPFLFMFLLVMLAGTYTAYTLNLLGPMMHMGNAAMTQGTDIAKQRLREYIVNSETARQALGVPADQGGENIPMDSLNKQGKKNSTEQTTDDI